MNHKHAMIILYAIIVSVITGIIFGWYCGTTMIKLEWIGTLFLNTLKMTIIPLVVTAIISSVASLGDIRKLGRLGGTTLAYYFTTTSIAVVIGLVVVNILQPGVGLNLDKGTVPEDILNKSNTGIIDIFLPMISPNLIKSAVNTRLIPIILFSIMFSAALTTIGKQAETTIQFFNGANKAMLQLITWIMYMAPLGIFFLVSARLGKAGGGEAFWNEIMAVGWHVTAVLTGLSIHFMILFLILVIFANRGWDYLVKMMRALLTAFGTASSSATLPLTMECVNENNVSERSARFTLPLGSTINMDGTALYEAAAAMFIAQAYNIEMGMTEQVIIFVTATLAAVGAAGIPEAGLVTMVIVLDAVGLPLEGIGILLAVDWFLDRFRTTVNVWGDAVGAAVVDRYEGKDK